MSDRRAYFAAYRAAHRERLNAQQRALYRKDPEKSAATRARSAAKNAAKNKVRKAAHYRANRDRILAAHLKHQRENRAAATVKMARWRAENRAHARATQKKWQDANREKCRTYGAKWAAANPHNVRERTARRRARMKGANGEVEMIDRLAIYRRDGGICSLCKQPVSERDFTLDHIQPLSKGGPHTAANLAVAHSRCNLSKFNKWPFEVRTDGRIVRLDELN